MKRIYGKRKKVRNTPNDYEVINQFVSNPFPEHLTISRNILMQKNDQIHSSL